MVVFRNKLINGKGKFVKLNASSYHGGEETWNSAVLANFVNVRVWINTIP